MEAGKELSAESMKRKQAVIDEIKGKLEKQNPPRSSTTWGNGRSNKRHERKLRDAETTHGENTIIVHAIDGTPFEPSKTRSKDPCIPSATTTPSNRRACSQASSRNTTKWP